MASSTTNIPLLYRIFFLYFEPFGALGGTYLAHFRPSRFIDATTPVALAKSATINPTPVSPLTQLLLTNIAALYAFFAINEILVLRVTKDVNVWKAVMVALCFSDLGHVYAWYAAAPDAYLNFAAYRSEDWINNGTLVLGLVIRVAFLLGIGMGGGKAKAEAEGRAAGKRN